MTSELEPVLPAGAAPLPYVQVGMVLRTRDASTRRYEVVAIAQHEGPGSEVRITLRSDFESRDPSRRMLTTTDVDVKAHYELAEPFDPNAHGEAWDTEEGWDGRG